MPYLKITCPELESARYMEIASILTDRVNDLFYNPKAPVTRDQLRERTTIHFTPYKEEEFYIGAQTPLQRNHLDITIECSDWNMTVKQQRKVAKQLTPLVAQLFEIPITNIEDINFRFHPYRPTHFAVGGKLLSDIIPLLGRLSKKVFG